MTAYRQYALACLSPITVRWAPVSRHAPCQGVLWVEVFLFWLKITNTWRGGLATDSRTTFKFKLASLLSAGSFKINSLRCIILEMGTVAR